MTDARQLARPLGLGKLVCFDLVFSQCAGVRGPAFKSADEEIRSHRIAAPHCYESDCVQVRIPLLADERRIARGALHVL